jgi:hypothetical protein
MPMPSREGVGLAIVVLGKEVGATRMLTSMVSFRASTISGGLIQVDTKVTKLLFIYLRLVEPPRLLAHQTTTE